MTAFYKATAATFLRTTSSSIVGELTREQAKRFRQSTPEQEASWTTQVDLLKSCLSDLAASQPRSAQWGVLFEYQLLRLQRRLDVVLLAGGTILVLEFKVGPAEFDGAGARQVEDYALDLRDFHAASRDRTIVPVLCTPSAESSEATVSASTGAVAQVIRTNAPGLRQLLRHVASSPLSADQQIGLDEWDSAPYRPVPTIIEAAELLYSGHQVSEISYASADVHNLSDTTNRLIEIIASAQANRQRAICFVTGVPGSGKTLTGLNAIHDPRFRDGDRSSGAFLSGNTPLVEVLREALARDDARRTGKKIDEARRTSRTEIQPLMRFLEEYLDRQQGKPPHEHVIVFDEAQRAWDAEYGKRKFNRPASEPSLFLEIMARHPDWTAIIALVGGGQEINTGEGGLGEWGSALAAFNASAPPDKRWIVYGTPEVLQGGEATAGQRLFEGEADTNTIVKVDRRLHLPVSVRSHRCEASVAWVNAVLEGRIADARTIANRTTDFPVYVTRSLQDCRAHLDEATRGTRRCGLVGSSGAGRLRAYGLGVSLSAMDLSAVRNWYLKPRGDIRASYALEVYANEYTCQGLELDHVGMCWGGDMLWEPGKQAWKFQALNGTRWTDMRNEADRRYTANTYRVLLTRARVETVIWVPPGLSDDLTCLPQPLNNTFDFLIACGARPLS